ncbi:unnamed protein product [Linum tenue]|uniref:Uncharacterized protein n=1 Tax=Linum tenue TaxID=586396 RepID=A0AAV0I992_9ROSI|nr:unnamed protein product [Linum tenue]
MPTVWRRGVHYFEGLKAANIPNELIEKGQSRVIDSSLILIHERAKLKAELLCVSEGVVASASLIGV